MTENFRSYGSDAGGDENRLRRGWDAGINAAVEAGVKTLTPRNIAPSSWVAALNATKESGISIGWRTSETVC